MGNASSMFASLCSEPLLYILLHTHVHKHKGHLSPWSRPPQQPWYASKKGRRPHLVNRRRLLLSVSGRPSCHRFAKFQPLLCHYSPTSWCPLRLLLLCIDLRDAVLLTKASSLGKRLLSWLDWPNSISSFCFLNIFFIFCNKINAITLFWYYVSSSSVKRPPAKCFPSHSMLTKFNISTRGSLVCCMVIAFITSLWLSLFLARCVVFVPPQPGDGRRYRMHVERVRLKSTGVTSRKIREDEPA